MTLPTRYTLIVMVCYGLMLRGRSRDASKVAGVRLMRVALKQVECFWARGAGITWSGDLGGYETRVLYAG